MKNGCMEKKEECVRSKQMEVEKHPVQKKPKYIEKIEAQRRIKKEVYKKRESKKWANKACKDLDYEIDWLKKQRGSDQEMLKELSKGAKRGLRAGRIDKSEIDEVVEMFTQMRILGDEWEPRRIRLAG